MTLAGRVAPLGDLRINGCSPLPTAYRSVPRPSSPLVAKASTKCPSHRLIAFRVRILKRQSRLDFSATQQRQRTTFRSTPLQSGSNIKTRLFVFDPRHQLMAVTCLASDTAHARSIGLPHKTARRLRSSTSLHNVKKPNSAKRRQTTAVAAAISKIRRKPSWSRATARSTARNWWS